MSYVAQHRQRLIGGSRANIRPEEVQETRSRIFGRG